MRRLTANNRISCIKATSPAVSIIIPAYNHARFLPQAIGSALEQTFQDLEVIVVDDGSTDNTCQAVLDITDQRLQYRYQPNRGLAAARNTGLQVANGEYVAFLDADDIFFPCKLELQVGWLRRHEDYGFVAGGWDCIDEQGKVLWQYKPGAHPPRLDIASWLLNCHVNPVSVLIRKGWVDKVGGFDESFRRVEDWDLWLRLAYAGCKMGWVNEAVCGYRLSPGQMTKDAASQKRTMARVLDKFFSQAGLPAELQMLKAKVYSHMYVVSAGREYAAGQCEDAKKSLAEAAKYDDNLLKEWKEDQVLDLVSWINVDWFDVEPIGYAECVFKNLPAGMAALQAKRRWALGEVSLKTFFTAYQSRDWNKVRRAARVIAMNAPQRMWNRGIWSILWQSIVRKAATV